MSWFYFSLISIFSLALAELTQQHILNKGKSFDERTSGVLIFLTQSILTVPLIIFTGKLNDIFTVFDKDIIGYLLLDNIIGSVAMVMYLRSFKVKNISFSSIFVSFSVVVTTTLGIIFFNEVVTPYKIVGILLVMASIVGVNYKNTHIEKNHKWGLLAGVLFGVAFSIDKSIATHIEPLIFAFWGFMFVALFGFVASAKKVLLCIKGSKIADYASIAISSFGYFIYNMCTFYAYKSGGEVGRVDAINNSQIFIIILFEYLIFKQTKGLYRKIFFALVAFSGVYILGTYK